MSESDTPKPGIITPEAMERWGSLPANRPIQMAFTPRELDNLFLAIRETIIAQNDMGAAMVALSNGNVEQAQKAFDASKQHTANALTNIDSLIVHAMKTAEPV